MNIPVRVIHHIRSNPLSPHCTEREVCAARLPASRDSPLSNGQDTQSSDRTPLPTLRLIGRTLNTASWAPTGEHQFNVTTPTWVTDKRYPAQQQLLRKSEGHSEQLKK